ncbi:MAG: hypothetical protein HC797_10005 [Anaerolineales bacterium]|nr:hypothetical protein [Anaerolineales bacterium]
MTDKNIQQVIEIEKQSQEIYEKAKREAQQLPVLAEQEAKAMIEKAKADAQEQARQIIAKAQTTDAAQGISDQATAKASELETLAKKN